MEYIWKGTLGTCFCSARLEGMSMNSLFQICCKILQDMNSCPDILLQDFLFQNRIHSSIKSSKSLSNKTVLDHHTTTVFDCWSLWNPVLVFLAKICPIG